MKRICKIGICTILLSLLFWCNSMGVKAEQDVLEARYFYYNQLNDLEKEIYNLYPQINVGGTVENTSIIIPQEIVEQYGLREYTVEALNSTAMKSMVAYVYDNPMERAIYRDISNIKNVEGKYILTVEIRSIVSTDELKLAKNRVEQIVAAVGTDGDLYTRTRKLWQVFVQSMVYNPYYPFASEKVMEYDDCILGCLNRNQGVCAGFADTFKLLCDELQIPCIQVGNAGHAWNFVKMDNGKWYSIDLSACQRGHELSLDYLLVGVLDSYYTGNPNYFISELYMGSPDFTFEFPKLADYQYVYTGNNVDFSVEEQEIFIDIEEYEYEVNADGETCTLTKYLGEDKGDLIVPETIDGYTVTKIGDAVYWANTGFTGDLVIPDTVVEIGKCAFMDCNGLTGELVLPEHLNTIETGAFVGCSNFTGDLLLPENVIIAENAFYRCEGFGGTCYIPDSVDLYMPIFSMCGFSAFEVNDTNENFSTYDGVIYTKDRKTLLMCPKGKRGELKIPDTVTKIAVEACFNCSKLTGELKLPEGLESIGAGAFSGTYFTGNLIIPDSVTEIGYAAFTANLDAEGFNSLRLSKNLETLEAWVFVNNCFKEPIMIPESLVNLPGPDEISPFHNTFTQLICNCTQTAFIEHAINNELIVEWLDYIHCGEESEDECENCVRLQLIKEIRRGELLLSNNQSLAKTYGDELRMLLEKAKTIDDGAAVAEKHKVVTELDRASDVFESYCNGNLGYIISGVVTGYDNASDGLIILYNDIGNAIESITVNYQQAEDKFMANYSFVGVVPGRYTVQYIKENHATKENGIDITDCSVVVDAGLLLLGDVDGNGKVNARDKKTVYNHIAGEGELTGYEFQVGDTDGNGKINARDKKMIYNHISGEDLLW